MPLVGFVMRGGRLTQARAEMRRRKAAKRSAGEPARPAGERARAGRPGAAQTGEIIGKAPRDAREGRAPFDAACTGKRSGHARSETLLTATRPAGLAQEATFFPRIQISSVDYVSIRTYYKNNGG